MPRGVYPRKPVEPKDSPDPETIGDALDTLKAAALGAMIGRTRLEEYAGFPDPDTTAIGARHTTPDDHGGPGRIFIFTPEREWEELAWNDDGTVNMPLWAR